MHVIVLRSFSNLFLIGNMYLFSFPYVVLNSLCTSCTQLTRLLLLSSFKEVTLYKVYIKFKNPFCCSKFFFYCLCKEVEYLFESNFNKIK